MKTEKGLQLPMPPMAPTGPEPTTVADLGEDAATILDLARNAIAGSTREVYARALRGFERWCLEKGAVVIPAEPKTVAGFITERTAGGTSPQSLRVVLAAIRAAHFSQGCLSPTDHPVVRQVMRGASRAPMGGRPDLRKQPLTAERELALLIDAIRSDIKIEFDMSASPGEIRAADRIRLAALRDAAIILLGFAGALRRSEIVALRVEDIRRVAGGLIVMVRRSKTNQERKGREVAILPGARFCPIEAVDTWIYHSGIANGPLFRRITRGAVVRDEGLKAASIARLIKERVESAGLDPERFSGHSLRVGFLTSAAKANASIWKMMDHAGQKIVDVTRGYVRDRELFENHPGKGLL